MKTKHSIEISNLFLSSIKSPDDYPEYYKETHEFIREFIVWLVYNGHEVSFSSDVSTIIDGKDAFSEGLEKNVFLELISGYRETVKRKKSVKYSIEYPFSCKSQWSDSFIAWLNEEGHIADYTIERASKINGTDIYRDNRLLKILGGLITEYDNLSQTIPKRNEENE
ncbi:MAG: hypothetical protein ABW166_04985 [Sedimenticola sp.]